MIAIALIVITCFRSNECIIECLQALSTQTRSDFKVVVVNNGHTDVLNSDKSRFPVELEILTLANNIGFAGGSNAGATMLNKGDSYDWIITLNPDSYPYPDWFENLMKAAQAVPQYGMLSSTLLKTKNPSVLDGAGDVYSIFGFSWRGGQGHQLSELEKKVQHLGSTNGFPVLSPCGAAAAYKADLFTLLRGFDEAYFCYLEDIDLGLRLQLMGYRCFHCTDAKVLHDGGASSDLQVAERQEFEYYYSYRNQIKLMLKIMPVPILFIMLPLYAILTVWVLFRTRKEKLTKIKLAGLRSGFNTIKQTLDDRKRIQRSRKISVLQIAKLLTWSPAKLRNRAF